MATAPSVYFSHYVFEYYNRKFHIHMVKCLLKIYFHSIFFGVSGLAWCYQFEFRWNFIAWHINPDCHYDGYRLRAGTAKESDGTFIGWNARCDRFKLVYAHFVCDNHTTNLHCDGRMAIELVDDSEHNRLCIVCHH